MITTLSHLEQKTHRNVMFVISKIRKEIRTFVIIFMVVGFIVSLVTNRSLFAYSFLDLWSNNSSSSLEFQGINTMYQSSVNMEKQSMQKLLDINTSSLVVQSNHEGQALKGYLQQKLGDYTIGFNTLPPVNRLIIPKFGQNIPIVTPQFQKPIEEVKQGDFDKELYKGVVKYPTTSVPGVPGNTLIFGHTSYESWKHNPYATVFRNLPKFRHEDRVQVVRNGQLYTYEMIQKDIIQPHAINNYYLSFDDNQQDTMMLVGCYPLGSDKKRIAVVFQRID